MSTALSHSPAEIVQGLLIGRGWVGDPEASTLPSWPVYIDNEPDMPDNCITIYDTTPAIDGRTQVDGEQVQHDGIQIRIRSASHAVGYAKARSILNLVTERVKGNSVTLDGVRYIVWAIDAVSLMRMGRDTGKTKRSLLTLNGFVSITVKPQAYVTSVLTTEALYYSSAYDDGYLYFGTYQVPFPKVVKVRVSDFTVVATLTLSIADHLICAAISSGFAYFVGDLGTIFKIRLSDFTEVAAMSTGKNFYRIEVADGFAYCTSYITKQILKLRLSDFTVTATLTLGGADDYVFSSTIDTVNGFIYLGTDMESGEVIKIRLSTFTEVARLTTSIDNLYYGSIDFAHGFIYFGGFTGTTKIRLSDFTVVGSISNGSMSDYSITSAIDTTNGFLYLGSNDPGIVTQIDLRTFTVVDQIVVEGEEFFTSIIVGNYVYFPSDTTPGKITKIRLTDRTGGA